MIFEAEDQIKKKVAQKTEQKIQAVHQRLHAFDLLVLAFPSRTIDLTIFQEPVASMRAHVGTILEMR